MRAVVGALVALLVALIGLGSVTAAEATQAPALVPYAYDASRYGAPPMGGITERGPPAAYDHAIYDAVANWSHGAEVRSDGPAPAAATDYEHPGTLAEVVWSTGTTDREAQTNSGSSFAFERNRVAANTARTAGQKLTTYYPPNRGFLGGSSRQTLEAGTRIDRYGREGGTFVSPAGTPLEMRSLPPGAGARPPNVYEVVEPFPVDAGTVAPWHGQLGFGTQYELPGSVADLIGQGFLKAVN